MNVQRVPAYMDVDGVKTEIGTAMVDLDMGCATVTIEHASAFHFVKEMDVNSFSYVTETPCNEHKPQQHRDAKPPWCDKCGLTANMEMPVGRFGNIRTLSAETDQSDHDFVD